MDAKRIARLLRGIEWAGRIWTDTEVCPSCGAPREGLPANKSLGCPEELSLTHRSDCELAAMLRECEA